MSKIVKTVIIVAIAVAVVVFAPQIAGVLASVAGSLGVTVAASAISSALIGMGISMALTAAATLFRKAPSMSQSMADRLNTSVVPTASRKIIFGTTAGGADVRFFEGDLDLPSTKKDGYVQVVALASHRINALKQFYVENDLVWQNGAFVSKRNGFAPNNPFRVVTEGKPGNGFSVGSGRYWNSSSTFTGCAYYVPFWKLDDEVWESGIPQRLTAIVEGCPLYDPRRDSTRGGSGAHRVNDQNTYAFRDGSIEIGRNPALALLTYLLGWRINGKVVWGMGIPANRIDFDNFRTYANLCEERVAVQGGGTVQRYTADGIFSTTDSHETVINGLTAAMGSCKLTDRGGTYCIVGGYDDTAGPKIAFDADDLVAPANGSSPYIWNPAPASRERFNIVRGRFANPDELYQLTDWGDPIEREPLADGIPRTMSVDLGAVSRAETCQRIAKQMLLREYLCPGMFAATFGPKAFAVEIGSVITLSLPAEGWNNKLFRVMEQAESHDLFFQMTLREEDPAIYAWDREEKPLPPTIRPQGYDPATTIIPANLTLSSASYSGANGVNVSEVHVSWTSETSGRVNGIQVQSRPAGSEAWTEQAALFDPKVGVFTFTSNAPGITVEVRARFRMMSAVYSPWTTASVGTAEVVTITDWDNVTDNKGTRPSDNATVGAPEGTNVGSLPVTTVVQKINALTNKGLTDDIAPPTPTGLKLESTLTDAGVTLTASWNPVSASDLDGYVIALQESSNPTFFDYQTKGTSYTRTAIPRNAAFTAKVLAYDKAGNQSFYSAVVSHTTARDTLPPAPVTEVSVETAFSTAFLQFRAPAEADFSHATIALKNASGVTVVTQTVNGQPASIIKASLGNLTKATSYSVVVTAYDTSNNASSPVSSASFTTAGGVSLSDFAPGLSGITTVAALPAPAGYTGATTVFNQADGKLYNYVGGAWVKPVDVTPADNSITGAKLADDAITSGKIATNAVTSDKLVANSITANKLTVQNRPISVIGINLRLDTDGAVRWGNGTITYPDSFGNYTERSISAGGNYWNAAWTAPVVLCYDSSVDNGQLVFYYKESVTANQSLVVVAKWNDRVELIVSAGVGSLLNGDRIVTGSLNAEKIIAGSITGDKIATGTIQAAQIAADAISVDKLLVSSMTELNPDPGFRDRVFWRNTGVFNGPLGGPGGPTIPGWYNEHATDVDGVMGTNKYAMLWEAWFTGTGVQFLSNDVQYNIRAGATYEVSFFANNASNQHFSVLIRYWKSDGTYLKDEQIVVYVGETLQNKRIQVTAPPLAAGWQFIVYNVGGPSYSGYFAIANAQVVEASASTAIMNGAITTDKLTASAVTADKILAGTITGDKFNTGTNLPGTITVGNTGVSIATVNDRAANSGNITYYDQQGIYNVVGNTYNKKQTTGWETNLYSRESYGYSAIVSGEFNGINHFLGFSFNGPVAGNFYSLSWAVHCDGYGDVFVRKDGNAITGAIGRGDGVWAIAYAGNQILVSRNGNTLAGFPTTEGQIATAGFNSYSIDQGIRNIKFGPYIDNSLMNTDPAKRINAYSTTIDPGRVLIQGSTTLDAWRDQTEIRGGAIKTNSIAAHKLNINAQGISTVGLNFRYENGALRWSEGNIFYVDDNGNAAAPAIAAGQIVWAGGYNNYLVWDKGATNFRHTVDDWQNSMSANSNSVVVVSWSNGSNFQAHFGGTIISGDRIVTRTIDAEKLNVSSLSAISANIGSLVSYNGQGGRVERDGNGTRIYDNNGVLRSWSGF